MRIRVLRIVYDCEDEDREDSQGHVNTPGAAAELFRQRLGSEPVEVFGVLCLNARHHVIGYHEVSRGTLDRALVHPREVFKAAVLANAASVIVTHNHPSRDPSPSQDDFEVTKRLVDASNILGIQLLDHIIVGGRSSHYSLRESGFGLIRQPGDSEI